MDAVKHLIVSRKISQAKYRTGLLILLGTFIEPINF